MRHPVTMQWKMSEQFKFLLHRFEPSSSWISVIWIVSHPEAEYFVQNQKPFRGNALQWFQRAGGFETVKHKFIMVPIYYSVDCSLSKLNIIWINNSQKHFSKYLEWVISMFRYLPNTALKASFNIGTNYLRILQSIQQILLLFNITKLQLFDREWSWL